MTTPEIELKALTLASLDGDAASHRALLNQLGRRLRAYYKDKLAGIGKGATEAEDLVQEAGIGNPLQAAPLGQNDRGRSLAGMPLLSIPIIAIVPFAAAIWAVGSAAPTNLARTGAFTGLIAGGVRELAYALHCTDDSLPFVAVWYSGTIVLCTLAGAALGPRLLRW